MPQTFLVVQCHECKSFQVDQEKKAKKWSCKMCSEKQSLQRVFARSHSAKDCRLVVQQYNEARGTIEAEDAEQALEAAAGGDGGWDEDGREAGAWGEQDGPAAAPGVQQQAQQQRWRAFQDQEAEDEDGWTLAVPERPAAAGRQKRGGEQGGTAGAGKRQRQHKAQEDEGAGSGWGGVACGTGPTGAQHWQQQPQQPQPRPLAAQNGGWMRAPGLQGGGGVAHSAPQAQPRQWQPGAQAAPDQRAWQPPPQQHRQPRQQPPPVQQEQQRWQQAPAKQQAWSSAPHRQQAPAGDPRAGGKGAAHAGAPNRWGGFMDADDEW